MRNGRPRRQISAGAGIVDFADDSAMHNTTVGGTWDVRLATDTRSLLGAEIAYVGTANGVNDRMAANAPDGVIVGTAVEADARLEPAALLRDALGRFSPYGFLGLGINRYSLAGETFRNGVAIDDGDTKMVVPFGAGTRLALTDRFGIDGRSDRICLGVLRVAF